MAVTNEYILEVSNMKQLFLTIALFASSMTASAEDSSFHKLDQCITSVIKTVKVEAGNQSLKTKQGIIHVIFNRANKYKTDVCSVVSAKRQFSPLIRHVKLTPSDMDPELISLIKAISQNKVRDVTGGAWYFNDVHDQKRHKKGFHKAKFTVQLGEMLFYKNLTV